MICLHIIYLSSLDWTGKFEIFWYDLMPSQSKPAFFRSGIMYASLSLDGNATLQWPVGQSPPNLVIQSN